MKRELANMCLSEWIVTDGSFAASKRRLESLRPDRLTVRRRPDAAREDEARTRRWTGELLPAKRRDEFGRRWGNPLNLRVA
jgi:hypothetical protein